jgi:tRNA threonylcarbamoyl adenosine modification protein YjeE
MSGVGRFAELAAAVGAVGVPGAAHVPGAPGAARAAGAELPGSGAAALTVDDPERMHAFGVEVGRRLGTGDLVLLTGDLGAGKTTFTRGLGEGLGVRGPVTSPTFVLARTHPSLVGGVPLVHVDAYRLGSALELDDLDIDFDHSVVVVEWGAGLIEAIAESWLSITIDRPHGAGEGGGDGEGSPDDSDEGAEPIEPRQVSLLAVGGRWA